VRRDPLHLLMASPGQILATLADLAPDSGPTVPVWVPAGDMAPIALGYTRLFEQALGRPTYPSKGMFPAIDERAVDRLVKRARLHDEQNLLRLGWLWVHGTAKNGSQVRFPLISMPVRYATGSGLLSFAVSAGLRETGEPELTELVTDTTIRDELDGSMEFGGGALNSDELRADPAVLSRLPRLLSWSRRAAAAAGFAAHPVVEDFSDRTGWTPDTYEIVAGVGLYVAEPSQRLVTIAATLRSWNSGDIAETAFAAVYGLPTGDPHDDKHGDEHRDEHGGQAEALRSPIVFSPAQAAAVLSTRRHPVTVISGPPGSGKTQTIAAAALDAIERRQSVLVAAPSDAAVHALIALMQRVPGPEPLVFGADEQRRAVADRLNQGGGALTDDAAVDAAEAELRRANEHVDAIASGVRELLSAEQLAAGADPALTLHARRIAPAWFEANADHAAADRLLARAGSVAGPFTGFRRRRRLRRLAQHAGGVTDDLDQLDRALETARAIRAGVDLTISGGLDLSGTWPKLIDADEQRRLRHGRWLDASTRSSRRVSQSARTTMGLVAAALRAGRSARRRMLGSIDGAALVDALPLWIGTLRDIDDLLPRTPGMFDLVIVDEASQVDQITAAPALLRARRALVVGDPRQLRHVSFLSDAAVDAARLANAVDATTAGLLDVRRLSLFDLAASAAPTHLLGEHFRSAPHLIGFSARHFYEGKLSIATTHPRNHGRDCISVEQIAGTRDDKGVNAAEIDRCLEIVRARQQIARECSEPLTIGIVTPYRAQADAIEQRVVDALALADIDELALRVGTVHGFQGCERDLIVVSLAVDDNDSPSSRAFLADANLFNVMITRARRELVVVTSLTAHRDGLVGEYLRYGSSAPAAPAGRGTPDPQQAALLQELGRSGVRPLANYPAGRHTLDLVLGDGDRAIGYTFGVHDDGPDAHIERRLALHRAGWELDEVFATKWGDRQSELAIELVLEAQRRVPS
jgi:hypothetical protein